MSTIEQMYAQVKTTAQYAVTLAAARTVVASEIAEKKRRDDALAAAAARAAGRTLNTRSVALAVCDALCAVGYEMELEERAAENPADVVARIKIKGGAHVCSLDSLREHITVDPAHGVAEAAGRRLCKSVDEAVVYAVRLVFAAHTPGGT